MKEQNAKEKLCPQMSTGFSADTHKLRNEGLIEIYCDPEKCMLWSPTAKGEGDCQLTLLALIEHQWSTT